MDTKIDYFIASEHSGLWSFILVFSVIVTALRCSNPLSKDLLDLWDFIKILPCQRKALEADWRAKRTAKEHTQNYLYLQLQYKFKIQDVLWTPHSPDVQEWSGSVWRAGKYKHKHKHKTFVNKDEQVAGYQHTGSVCSVPPQYHLFHLTLCNLSGWWRLEIKHLSSCPPCNPGDNKQYNCFCAALLFAEQRRVSGSSNSSGFERWKRK